MREIIILTIEFWLYSIVAGIVLISLRDDAKKILSDMKIGFKNSDYLVRMMHGLMLSILIPLSIPFSFVNIINRWL